MTILQIALKQTNTYNTEAKLEALFLLHKQDIIDYGIDINTTLPYDDVKFLWYWWWIAQKKAEGVPIA